MKISYPKVKEIALPKMKVVMIRFDDNDPDNVLYFRWNWRMKEFEYCENIYTNNWNRMNWSVIQGPDLTPKSRMEQRKIVEALATCIA